MSNIFFPDKSQTTEFSHLLKQMEEEQFPLLVNGLSQPQRAHMAFVLGEQTQSKIVMICSNEMEAEHLYDDLSFYFPENVLLLKNDEVKFYTIEAKDRKEETKRIASLMKLAQGDYRVLLLSVETLMRRYLPPEVYRESRQTIRLGDSYDPDELVKRLVGYGYERELRTESPGQFSVRGGIIDLFIPTEEFPFRLEFFDDEVDSIRIFDPLTQKSLDKVREFTLVPAREIIFQGKTDFQNLEIEKDLKHKSVPNEDLIYDLDRLRRGEFFEGIHNYIQYLFPTDKTNLFSYFSKNTLFILNEPNRVMEKGENYYEEFQENYKDALEKGFALKSQAELLLPSGYVADVLAEKKLLMNAYMPKAIKAFSTAGLTNFRSKEPVSVQGKIENLAEELKYLKNQEYATLLVERDDETLRSLQKNLTEMGVEVRVLNEKTGHLPARSVSIIKGRLSEGYMYPDSKLAVFTDKEIFGVTKQSAKGKRKTRYKGRKIDSFVDMNPGDYVVHESYGVGRFAGIESKIFDDIRKDYIKVVYSGGDALYVPLASMDKVQKYIGGGISDSVKLSKLGTSQWKKAKSKARKSVEEIARYLIELYAKRRDARGFAFSEDTPWQKEFETIFPYEETTDQLQAISEVKKDMESVRPMDRLICGDVGYGKTEVAIRAIFKTCMDSKQAAFLVPTTILAQQHYNTLKERFADYPIRIEVVSRFKTKKEQAQILEDAGHGMVDVLIGTHRILSKDIKFSDLGLLVVDEEQRFGVKHKEILKEMKKDVDVLTLSATPIPRTLHLSLSGIRDMSILEEPPEDRHPIMTYVTEAREGIILDAIEREMARGGQVFFVYNRVETIDKMAGLIKRLVPEARIAVAHGQMSPGKLEDIMVDFLEKEYDILLCTTIIETGMDISNANTMIVYDADKMGLSQLYQLRGRVGRSARQAYAYFMYQKDKVLTEISEKRLKAIKEFTEFGSGFKIAMRDLEIRGAGNILGERQHGHMAEIGYDLYVKMLDEAVRTLQGQQIQENPETEIDLDVSAYIPDSYIDDEMTKMEMYKKIAFIENKEDLYEMEEEIEDRFSDIPEPTRNLLRIAYIKSMASKLGIVKIKQDKSKIHFITEKKEDSVKKDFKGLDGYKLVTNIAEFLELMI